MAGTNGKNHHKQAGILIPVFAIRRRQDLGIGDVTGVRATIDWLHEMGMQFLQLLPINETGGDNSPYNAISSVAIEPSTLDVSPEGLRDLKKEDYERIVGATDLEALREGSVNYEAVKALKADLLWEAFDTFWRNEFQRDTIRDKDFLAFCEREKSWLGDYSLFRLLMDMEGGSEIWTSWANDYDTLAKARDFVDVVIDLQPEQTEKQLAYYAYVQWVAFSQWEEVREYARSRKIELMGDMPFGISYYSADVFCHPELFDLEWSCGAPPETNFKDDEFTQKWGQNWGVPLYRWDALESTDFAWWRVRISRICRIFSSFRIDHALGFYRIYSFPWRPERNEEFLPLDEREASARTDGKLPRFFQRADDSEEDKSFNREAGEKYLRIIKQAAGPAAIVAEDLGMVPEYVPQSLESLGIPGMKVPVWEKTEEGKPRPGKEYPYLSFATYATHDHEPLKTQWEYLRKTARRANGDEKENARRQLKHLAEFAGLKASQARAPYDDTIREAFLKALFESKSRYASVMVTDLLGIEERFNIPGVVGQGNWTTRMRDSVEDLTSKAEWRKLAERTRDILKETGRLTA